MKLTKSKLKQIIKEELEDYPGEWGPTPTASLNSFEDAIKSVLPVIKDAYDSLADDESKALFEDYLLKNLEVYVDKWREERAVTAKKAPTANSPGPWE